MPKHNTVNDNAQPTINYYNRRESRLGYKAVVRGTKHYGFYPQDSRFSMKQAQRCMESMLGGRLSQPQGAKVLDAGCGEGYVAIHLAQDFGYEIHGIDLLDWSIAAANKNKRKTNVPSKLFFNTGDYNAIDYPDNYFDAVYTMETLVHSPDYKKTLKEFYRVLKPGGVIVNQEYAFIDKLPEEDEAAWRFMFDACPMPTFDHFRESRMQAIWEEAGFTSVIFQDAKKNIALFMRRFFQLAFIPFHLLKLFGQEKRYVNIYAAVKSYQLRHQFIYAVMVGRKPSGSE